jgi:ketosteroid isomerase-like protein
LDRHTTEEKALMADNGQKIIDLDKKRMAAMVHKDIATLNAVLSDDLVYTHTSARLDTKQSLIAALASRTVSTFEPTDVKAQDLGDAVVLTGSVRICTSSNGTPVNFRARFTAIYANKGEKWQLVASQFTRLPE